MYKVAWKSSTPTPTSGTFAGGAWHSPNKSCNCFQVALEIIKLNLNLLAHPPSFVSSSRRFPRPLPRPRIAHCVVCYPPTTRTGKSITSTGRGTTIGNFYFRLDLVLPGEVAVRSRTSCGESSGKWMVRIQLSFTMRLLSRAPFDQN